MATKGIYFGGRTILIPGAYAIGDASDLVEITVGALNIVMLIGEADGGEPFKPLIFNAAGKEQALATLRGGPLYEAAKAAWTPSPASRGADVVIALNVRPSTRAQHLFADTNTAPALTVKARDWHKHGNNVQVAILAGTVNAALRQVVVKKIDDGVDLKSPELGRVLGLAYTGDGTAASVDLNVVAGVPTLEVAVTGATDGSASFTKALNDPDVATIGKLAAWLNAQTGLSVKLYGHETMPSVQLDPIDAPVALTVLPVDLLGVNGAVADWITRFCPAAVGEFEGNAATVAPAGPIFLQGGTQGVPTLVEWKKGLRKLETQPGYFLVPATGDELVHQACLDHVLRMSDVKIKRRRQLFVGGDVGLVVFNPDGSVDLAALEQRIFKLNSDRAVFATPGIVVESEGTEKLFGSWLTAAAMAGMKAGGLPQESLTYKFIKCLGLEGEFDQLEQEQAILAAASPVVAVPNAGFQIVLSQFAQNRSTNVLEVEPSVLHSADTILTNLEDVLGRKYTGQPLTADPKVRLGQIKYDAERVLEEAKKLGLIVGGFAVTDVRYANRTYSLQFKAALAEPGNYITILAKWQAVQASA